MRVGSRDPKEGWRKRGGMTRLTAGLRAFPRLRPRPQRSPPSPSFAAILAGIVFLYGDSSARASSSSLNHRAEPGDHQHRGSPREPPSETTDGYARPVGGGGPLLRQRRLRHRRRGHRRRGGCSWGEGRPRRTRPGRSYFPASGTTAAGEGLGSRLGSIREKHQMGRSSGPR